MVCHSRDLQKFSSVDLGSNLAAGFPCPDVSALGIQALGGGVAVTAARSRSGLGRWLSQPWWVGLGVLLATAVAL